MNGALAEAYCEIEQLRTALESNRIIATAIGILIERHHLDREAAFAFLAHDSSHRNIKLHVVAEELVVQAESRTEADEGFEGRACAMKGPSPRGMAERGAPGPAAPPGA
jgi:hypothetical protein